MLRSQKRLTKMIFLWQLGHFQVGVSTNRGTPKWMVYIMENPIKMDDLGVPLFFGNTQVVLAPQTSPRRWDLNPTGQEQCAVKDAVTRQMHKRWSLGEGNVVTG